MTRSIGLAAIAALIGGAGLAAQTGPAPPAYAAAQFACSRWHERVRTDIRAETAGRTHLAAVEREGVVIVRGERADPAVALEAWYDSLAVRRTASGLTLAPDADGVLGGRYRGTLTPDGRYAAEVRPFVPDELQEIARLDRALDAFFPRLPGRPLRVGESWHEPPALEIRRLADSAGAAGAPLLRFRLTDRRAGVEPGADSLPLEVQQETEERTEITWDPRRGLVRLAGTATVTSMLPPSRVLPRTVKTVVAERRDLIREADGAADQCP